MVKNSGRDIPAYLQTLEIAEGSKGRYDASAAIRFLIKIMNF